MKYLKQYKQILKENLEIIDQEKINIGKFENEVSDVNYINYFKTIGDLIRDKKWVDASKVSGPLVALEFNKNDLIKLNYCFGDFKNINNYYDFNINFGGFGKERINFKGHVIKKGEKKVFKNFNLNLVNYFIVGDIKVKLGNHEGKRNVILKIKNIKDVITFFETFEAKIDLWD